MEISIFSGMWGFIGDNDEEAASRYAVTDGGFLVIGHASSCGDVNSEAIDLLKPGDKLICCHPNTVRKNPVILEMGIEVLGNWDGPTFVGYAYDGDVDYSIVLVYNPGVI